MARRPCSRRYPTYVNSLAIGTDGWLYALGRQPDGKTDLFTGEIWLARRAAELGLIDGIAHLKPKMQEVFGDKVQFRQYGLRRPFLSRLTAGVMDEATAAIEERAAYARFGL